MGSQVTTDRVHVYEISLRLGDGSLVEHMRVLGENERERAQRFRFPQHMERYVLAHSAVRRILSSQLNLEPSQIRFEVEASGKPILAGDGNSALDINLSHSGELALFAMAKGRRVGVDVEHMESGRDHSEASPSFMSGREFARQMARPAADRPQAFFDCWTRKEAYLKALGTGLLLDPTSVEILPVPCSFSSEHACPPDFTPDGPVTWSFVRVPTQAGYNATLCASGRDWEMSTFQFEG